MWKPIVPSWITGPQRHDSQHPRTAPAETLRVEDDVSSAALCSKLFSHAHRRKHGATCDACGLGTRHRASGYFLLRLRLEHLELNVWRIAFGPHDPVPKRSLAVGLLAEPERPYKGYFSTAIRRLAKH